MTLIGSGMYGGMQLRITPYSTAVYEATVSDSGLQVMSPTTDLPFETVEYSRFKYGFYPQAEQYGSLIADALIRYFTVGMKVDKDEPIVLLGTPYKSVPNAAKLLAGIASRKLRQNGYSTFVSRIYQPSLASGDYGKLSASERAIRNDSKVRFFEQRDFTGKHVVLVDDVQVTGSITGSVTRLLEDLDLRSLTIINLVRLHFTLSETRGAKVEDTLNHAYVKSLNDLLPLMAVRGEFVLIARTVKRILEAGEPELRAFLSQLDTAQLVELYHAAADEGYAEMESYERSFRTLEEFYPY